jgi:hypothetical protein
MSYNSDGEYQSSKYTKPTGLPNSQPDQTNDHKKGTRHQFVLNKKGWPDGHKRAHC